MSGKSTGDGTRGHPETVSSDEVARKRQRRAARRREQREAEKNKPKSGDGSRAMTVFTGVLAIVGVGALIVAVIPQRADVRVIGINKDALLVANKPAQYLIGLHNYGQINARIIEGCGRFINTIVKKWPADPDVEFPGPCPDAELVVDGGHTQYIQGGISAPGDRAHYLVMPDSLVQQIRAGTTPAMVMGRIKYRDAYSSFLNPRDIFGPKTLYYCFQYVAADGDWATCPMKGYSN